MEIRRATKTGQMISALVLMALILARPIAIQASQAVDARTSATASIIIDDYHIEDTWQEIIHDDVVELNRYHYHLDRLPAGATVSEKFCAIASEVGLSEAEVDTYIKAGTLEAEVTARSQLDLSDFHTGGPLDNTRLRIDTSPVQAVENLNGYECTVYLDNAIAFTTRVIVVGEIIPATPTPEPIDTPEPTPTTPATTDEIIDEQYIEETTITNVGDALGRIEVATPLPTITPTPTPTPTPSVTPTPTPTSVITDDVGAALDQPADPTPLTLAAPKKAMSVPIIAGTGLEGTAAILLAVRFGKNLSLIKWCKRKG